MNLLNIITIPAVRELPFPLFNQIAIITINFTVGLLVITVLDHLRKKRTAVENNFLLMSFFMLAWVDGAYLARLFGNSSQIALPLLRFAWFATPILFYLTYLTSVHFVKKQIGYRKISIFLFGITAVMSILAIATPLVISGYGFTNGILDIVYGIAFYPYLLVVAISMLATITSLWKTKLGEGVKTFMFGVIVFYVLNGIFNITLPVFFHITNLYFIGDYSTTFLLLATTYAIIRHELFDIKVFATELLTVFIWIVLFVRIFAYSGNFVQSAIDLTVFLITVLLGMLVIRSVRLEVEQRNRLSLLTNQLQDLDAKKDEFINMAAHELRAPLTAIKGFLSMVIAGDAGAISNQAKGFLDDSAVSTERMIRLVNNMLNVSRIEEGRMMYQQSDIHVSITATSVYNEFKVEAERKALQFELLVPSNIIDFLTIDDDKLHEVIVNYVSNAIKYTEKGSVQIILSNPSPHILLVEVKDTGQGISKEEQRKLFQKFYRVEAKVGKTIGTGLGLYISKLLIKKFGGEIGVTSSEGTGSNFWFKLPVKTKVRV